jgi:hypothetical protein
MAKKQLIYHNSDGTIVTKEYDIPDKFNEEGYLMDNRVKSIRNEFKLLPRELTRAERGDLMDLRTLIGNDQLLVHRSNGVWKPYTIKEIANFLATSELQAKRLIKKAKKYKVIAEINIEGTTYYLYNPYYERVVRRISFVVYLAFQNSQLRDCIEPMYRGKLQEQAMNSNRKIEVIE